MNPSHNSKGRMTIIKAISIIGTIVGASSGIIGWLWHMKADRTDLQAHVVAHQIQRDSDQFSLKMYFLHDSIWKAEQRAITFDNWCHLHNIKNCEPTLLSRP